ncbi:ribosome maturation factor RimP [Streptomyces sp. NP160]|uniref:ribosome maturation factor RimP n=1 Tax=Streptomyces sp. NP160 TaxID=2586637 RepID=UPI001118CA76|nr:ribosome maturation factor RimP [Streptomyces sp. NP160]TNM62419.1 ribosome maturation factor RimP [Streptomyces sp. NP160]
MPAPQAVHDRVVAAVQPAVTSSGLVLEEVELARAGARTVVRVVVDLPDDAVGAVSSDQLAAVSRAVSAAMDSVDGVLGDRPYVLEVGSPGVSRPLTERRHWSRARTRLVAVPVAGVATTGRVVAVDDGGVVLDVDGEQRRAAWDELGTGRVQVEFGRAAGAAADDDADDEIDELDEDED